MLIELYMQIENPFLVVDIVIFRSFYICLGIRIPNVVSNRFAFRFDNGPMLLLLLNCFVDNDIRNRNLAFVYRIKVKHLSMSLISIAFTD